MNDCVGLCGCGKGLAGVRDSRGGDSHGCGEGASDWGIVSRDGTAMIWCDNTMIGSIVFFLVLLDGIPQQSLAEMILARPWRGKNDRRIGSFQSCK